jgi:hypothetical protein
MDRHGFEAPLPPSWSLAFVAYCSFHSLEYFYFPNVSNMYAQSSKFSGASPRARINQDLQLRKIDLILWWMSPIDRSWRSDAVHVAKVVVYLQ